MLGRHGGTFQKLLLHSCQLLVPAESPYKTLVRLLYSVYHHNNYFIISIKNHHDGRPHVRSLRQDTHVFHVYFAASQLSQCSCLEMSHAKTVESKNLAQLCMCGLADYICTDENAKSQI